MKGQIREPKQERSIEKKNKIIRAGYELFAENGYHNTNTVQIAKHAGVSTGIVYGYFKDKRDILLSVLEIYIEEMSSPVLELIDSLAPPVDYGKIIPQILDITIASHRELSKIHEALHSTAHVDKAVAEKFTCLEDELTLTIANRLSLCGERVSDSKEKVHFAINIIQSFCHECICDEHCYIDYSAMKKIVVQSLIDLFV